ncbi:MAG: hypothetical protein DBX38_07510 [Eubacteriales Family XIII. Incertae Sedis bacterium]|nr:MAG: hypothetical protein DBX38_07510 [Clostridiales Family XIII bacterium]
MKIKTAQELVLCKSCAVYWPFCFCILLFIVVISYYSFLKIIAFVSHKAAVCLLYILIIIFYNKYFALIQIIFIIKIEYIVVFLTKFYIIIFIF